MTSFDEPQDGAPDENWDNWDEDEDEGSEAPVAPWNEEDEAPDPNSVPVEMDPEDPASIPEQFYKVQFRYEVGDEEIEPGTEIEVKCSNCALWETALPACGDEPLCAAGVRTTVKVGDEEIQWRMSADRYSCQSRFVPLDMQELLSNVTDDFHDVRALQLAFPTIKRLVALQDRIRKYYARHDLGDPQPAINNMLDFATMFASVQQVDYVRPFIEHTHKLLQAKQAPQKVKTTRTKRPKPGERASWLISQGGTERVLGSVRVVDNRNKVVDVLVTGDDVELVAPDMAATWREQNPEAPLQQLQVPIRYDLALWNKLDPRWEATIPVIVMSEADDPKDD